MVRIVVCNSNFIRNIGACEAKAVRLVKRQLEELNWYHTTYGPKESALPGIVFEMQILLFHLEHQLTISGSRSLETTV